MSEKRFSKTERGCYVTALVFDNQTQEKLGTDKAVILLNELYEENERLQEENNILNMNEEDLKECTLENIQLKEENKQLLYKLQQTKEYLQTKIDECKNPKKMKEIVFGVEQAKGYEKALLQFQKGLKRRLNDE